jgi:Uma2 family endonuclease
MVQRLPDAYRIDPLDPRAPSEEHWARMSPEERARVVAALPAQVPEELQPPEGDFHRKAKVKTTDTLDEFFQRIGRKIYVSSELAVFYPDEPHFSPDVFAVLDVEHRDRTKWVVTEEGKGLDLVIEVHYAGDKAKDYKANVERYARLGIHEYFIFDRLHLNLHGYRLSPPEEGQASKRRAYRPILPQGGLFASQVLGLDLTIEGSRLRFFYGMAPVPEAEELVAKLQIMVDGLHARAEEAEQRAAAEAERADAATTRADEFERQLVKTREETLRLGIEGLCDVLAIELDEERRTQLDVLDATGLEALQRALRAARRWP